MALIGCHECGSQVSSEATACPKCGAKPKAARSPSFFQSKISWPQAAVLLIVGFGAIYLAGFAHEAEPSVHAKSTPLDANAIGAEIEPGARIMDPEVMTTEQLALMVRTVRNSGYQCDSISTAGVSGISNVGVRLRCDRGAHSYDMHDRGGRLVVTVE